VHLGELGAASEDVEKAQRVALKTPELQQLVEVDSPRANREEDKNEEHDLGQRRRVSDRLEDAQIDSRRARRLRLQGNGVVTKGTHKPSVDYKARRWESADW
jgi:hypothetical protein